MKRKTNLSQNYLTVSAKWKGCSCSIACIRSEVEQQCGKNGTKTGLGSHGFRNNQGVFLAFLFHQSSSYHRCRSLTLSLFFPQTQEEEGAEHLFQRLQESSDDASVHFDIVCILPALLFIHSAAL